MVRCAFPAHTKARLRCARAAFGVALALLSPAVGLANQVTVTLVPHAEALGRTTVVSFGVPIPAGLVQDAQMISVTLENGEAVPAFIRSLGRWQQMPPASLRCPAYATATTPGIRSVLVQFEMRFVETAPTRVVVRFDAAPPSRLTTETPVRSTWRLVNEGTYTAAERIFEPSVYALLPPEWLTCADITTLSAAAGSDAALAPVDAGQVNFFKAVINDFNPSPAPAYLTDYRVQADTWLYDRAQTFYNGYVRTGRIEFLREAHRAAQHYMTLLYRNGQCPGIPDLWCRGFFKLKNPPTQYYKDSKYSYNESLTTLYWLTGDPEPLTHLADVTSATRAESDITRPLNPKTFTERHRANALVAALMEYEVTGDASLLLYVQNGLSALYAMQTVPINGLPATGCFNHYVEGNPIISFSPWMSSLLAHALLRGYYTTGDTRVPGMLSALADCESTRGIYFPTAANEPHMWLPRYIATSYDTPASLDGDPWGDAEHAIDVAYVTALGAYFTNDPALRVRLRTVTANLLGTHLHTLGLWTRPAGYPANGAPLYRALPARKYSWWYKNAGALGRLVPGLTIPQVSSATALETLPPPFPTGPAPFRAVSGAATGVLSILSAWKQRETMRQGGTLTGWSLWGLSAFDYDRDGDLDLLVTQHSTLGGLLLRNMVRETGTVTFSDATAALGLDTRTLPPADGKPIPWDFDGDGWVDVGGFSDSWFQTGSFFNAAGAGLARAPTSFYPIAKPTTIADLNGDGYLDVADDAFQFVYTPSTRTYRKSSATASAPAIPQAVASFVTLSVARTENRFLKVRYIRNVDLDGNGIADVIVAGHGAYGGTKFGRYLLSVGGTLTDATESLGLPLEGTPIHVEDLNADGTDDVVVASGPAPGVYVSRPSGRFERTTSSLNSFLGMTTEQQQQRVISEDLDNDGVQDLVVISAGLGRGQVLHNGGGGSFQLVFEFTCWPEESVEVGDFNNDGAQDLLVGGPGDDITLYLGAPSAPGAYVRVQPYMEGPNVNAVGAVVEAFSAGALSSSGAARPFLRKTVPPDGRAVHVGMGTALEVDIRITYPDGSHSERRLTGGDVTVSPLFLPVTVRVAPASVTVNVSPSSILLPPAGHATFTASVSGTLNHSVTWSAAAGSVDANGEFVAPVAPGTYQLKAVSVADTSKQAVATIVVLPPIGAPAFRQADPAGAGIKTILQDWKRLETIAQGGTLTGWWPWSVQTFDYDRDGDLDLLILQRSSLGGVVLRNQLRETGTLKFENVTSLLGLASRDFPLSDAPPRLWDADGDGWVDLAWFWDRTYAKGFLNRAGLGLARLTTTLTPLARAVRLEDVNGDGLLDVRGERANAVFDPIRKAFVQQVAPSPAPQLPQVVKDFLAVAAAKPVNRFLEVTYLANGDLNGDGVDDLVVSAHGAYGGEKFGFYLVAGPGGASEDATDALGLPREGTPLLLHDFNADGVADVLVSNGPRPGLYVSSSDGRFRLAAGPATAFLSKAEPTRQRAFLEDFDNDGDQDLLMSSPRLGLAELYENQGNGGLTLLRSLKGWDSEPIAIADFDNDGRMDVAIGIPGDDVALVLNETSNAGNFVRLSPRLETANTQAVGAVIEVYASDHLGTGARPFIRKNANADGLPVNVGLGYARTFDLRVTFPGIGTTEYRNVTSDRNTLIVTPAGIRPAD